MINNKKRGFTLIELIAVILIIAIIAMIAFSQISNLIEGARKKAFANTAYALVKMAGTSYYKDALKEKEGFTEYYFKDGVQYSSDNKKLSFNGKVPKNGVIYVDEKGKASIAIHNGKYCATKETDKTEVTISEVSVSNCVTYHIIDPAEKTWEELAEENGITVNHLVVFNETNIDTEPSTIEVKIPISISPNSASGDLYIDYKTFYSVGYITSSTSVPRTVSYEIELGNLPVDVADIATVNVTTKKTFESLDDFKRYIVRKNMGDIIYPSGDDVYFNVDYAETLKAHSLNSTNMSVSNVTVTCTTSCKANITVNINNKTGAIPNDIEGQDIIYMPSMFTVEFEYNNYNGYVDETPGELVYDNGYYLIESTDDLIQWNKDLNNLEGDKGLYQLNNNYKLMTNVSIKGKDVDSNTDNGNWVPIGQTTGSFSGIFKGQSNRISDVNIVSTANYSGFMGRLSSATIDSLVLNSLTVDSTADYCGGISGYTSGTKITNVKLSNGSITGNNYVAGAVGHANGSYNSFTNMDELLIDADVTGNSYVAGIVGYNNYNNIKAIYMGSSIQGTSTTGTIAAYNYSSAMYGSGSVTGFMNSEATLNGTLVTGSIISGDYLNNIITLENMGMDTFVGGDSYSNGYVYEYEDGLIKEVAYNSSDYQITMSGSGTEVDPYLITSAAQWEQMNYKLSSYYKLANNIDFTSYLSTNIYYPIGSRSNPFTGRLDGNGYTVSNIEVLTNMYGGLFGSIDGATIENFKVNNISIEDPSASLVNSSYLGGITAYARNSTARNIDLSNVSITSKGKYAGGILGSSSGATIQNINVNNVAINSLGDYVGGAAGNLSSSTIQNVEIKDSTINTTKDYAGGISGYTSSSNIMAVNIANGSITGNNYVAGAIGHANGSYNSFTNMDELLIDVDVTGNSYVAGIVGYNYYNNFKAIYMGSSIEGTSTTGAIAAYNYSSAMYGSGSVTGFINSGATLDGTLVTGPIISGDYLNNIITLENMGMDTFVGGDSYNNGYIYEYENGVISKVAYNSAKYQITMSGSGTEADPYLITTPAQWEQMNYKLSSYYKLANNIDFASYLSTNIYYPIGSRTNPFTGRLDGNGYTVSNIEVSTNMYGGLFGSIDGATIENFKVNNITIEDPSASLLNNSYLGGISAYVRNSTVKNIDLNTVSITGKGRYAGGILGSSSGATVQNVDVNNVNIHSSGEYVGGVAGNLTSSTIQNIEVENATIYTIRDYAGGISGYTSSSNMATISLINGSITGSNYVAGAVGRTNGSYNSFSSMTDLVIDADVEGNSYIAGIIGYNYYNNVKAVYVGNSIMGNVSYSKLVSYNYSSPMYGSGSVTGYTNADATVNGSAVVTNVQISASDIINISFYQGIGYDTTDSNSDGVYWYINNNWPSLFIP